MHSPLGDDAEIALHDLRRLVQGIRASSHAVERTWNLTGAQLFVLHQLSLEPGASIRRLSERTLTDPSSVSVVISRLVARGLVTRTLDATDRRKSALSVSKKGAKLLASTPEPYQDRLIVALRELPPTDLRALKTSLVRLCDALGLEPAAAPFFFEEATPRRKREPRDPR